MTDLSLDDALAALNAIIEPGRAEGQAKYHKQSRGVLGIPNPALNDLTKEWRQSLSVEDASPSPINSGKPIFSRRG